MLAVPATVGVTGVIAVGGVVGVRVTVVVALRLARGLVEVDPGVDGRGDELRVGGGVNRRLLAGGGRVQVLLGGGEVGGALVVAAGRGGAGEAGLLPGLGGRGVRVRDAADRGRSEKLKK